MKRKKDYASRPNFRKKHMANYRGQTFLLNPREEFQDVEIFIKEREGSVIHEKDDISQRDPINMFVVANKNTWKLHYTSIPNVIHVDFFDDNVDPIHIPSYFIQPLLRGIPCYAISSNVESEDHIIKTIQRLGGFLVKNHHEKHSYYVYDKNDTQMDLSSLIDVQIMISLQDLLKLESQEICRVGDKLPDFVFEEICSQFPVTQERDKNIKECIELNGEWNHELPKEIFLRIFAYLPRSDYLNTRLVCKSLSEQSDPFWKNQCSVFLTESMWIPLIDMNLIRNSLTWFQFWSKHIRPIVKDKLKIERHFCEFYSLTHSQLYDLISWKSHDVFNLAIVMETSLCFNPCIGISKFGGVPDLPKSLSWPKDYRFHCQINTRDPDFQNTFCAQSNQVPHGIYYFFYALSEEKGQDHYVVKFYDGDLENLTPTHDPADTSEILHFLRPSKCYKVKFFETIGIISSPTYYGVFGNLLSTLSSEKVEKVTVLPHLPFRDGENWNYQALFGNAVDHHPRIVDGTEDSLLHSFLQSDVYFNDTFARDVYSLTFAIEGSMLLSKNRTGTEFAESITMLTSP